MPPPSLCRMQRMGEVQPQIHPPGRGSDWLGSAGRGVDEAVLKACSNKVAQACSTAHKAMRGEGLRVLELMSADCSAMEKAKGCSIKWSNILQVRCPALPGTVHTAACRQGLGTAPCC